ncbi:hypothetical protein DEM27_01790 [Metarhizobium album]|uniref:Uncharacterized protein n=1 Tax=Metarhizobium album TaxID=2182425 RepID=A0A2U2DX95_9HYPH|nr:hypothetical protein [Rhizobium album]PWE57947.1 hypothetical protein DEM27_01790 [Rhizobium album]
MKRFPGSAWLAAVLFLLFGMIGPALADPPHPNLYKGEKLVPIEPPVGKPLELSGWTRDGRSHVYSLHVKRGQTVGINFWTPSRFTYLVMFDVSRPDDEAFYSSDEDGNIKSLPVANNTTWLIRPYYSRVSPRRGLGAPYKVVIGIK